MEAARCLVTENPMQVFRLFRPLATSVGQKCVMAASGLLLVLFVLGHLAGNLGVFSGRDVFNGYAALLHSVPKLLWVVRITLVVAFVLHVVVSIRLSIQNRKARGGQAYARRAWQTTSLASRTMLWAGLVLLAFLVFHLCHLTWGWVYPEHARLIDAEGRPDVYAQVVLGFQNVWVVVFYMLAQVALFMHLSHGFSSAGHTLGLNSVGSRVLRVGGVVLSGGIFALYTSIPLAVQLGVLLP
ncbi:MAG: succinate dehydrogenase cytochrome b subunit [Myxococcota bacterium]